MGIDPISLGMFALTAVGTAAGAAGTYESMQGAKQQASATAANASYQAAVAANNALIAKQNAAWATGAGENELAGQGMKAKSAVGGIQAAQGANNIDVNSGSAAAVSQGARELAGVDARTIMSNATKQAYGYQVAANSATAQGQLYTQEAGQAIQAGNTSALGSFLSGISSTANNFARYLPTSGIKFPGGGGNPGDPGTITNTQGPTGFSQGGA